MHRQPSQCDFCGDSPTSQEYQGDHGVVTWSACGLCAEKIETESWGDLIERCLAAYRRIRPIPAADEPVLREQVEHLVEAFREFRSAPVWTAY